jgi:hypothetical protein
VSYQDIEAAERHEGLTLATRLRWARADAATVAAEVGKSAAVAGRYLRLFAGIGAGFAMFAIGGSWLTLPALAVIGYACLAHDGGSF